MVMIDIEFIDAQLDYNILLGSSYMYAMKVVTSLVFCIMMFPFNGKVVILDQLSYYNPHASTNLENSFPMVSETSITPYVEIVPGVYKEYDLLGAYLGPPPIIPPTTEGLMCNNHNNNLFYPIQVC